MFRESPTKIISLFVRPSVRRRGPQYFSFILPSYTGALRMNSVPSTHSKARPRFARNYCLHCFNIIKFFGFYFS